MPNFEIPFVVETDACDVGIRAVLLQLEHPIAYFSKKLSQLRQKASTYSKEFWALTKSVQKWRHYLLGSEFTIRTDHYSLKNLLAQSIQSPEQQYFLTRLLGFTFKFMYKKGKDNIVADALSRLPATEEELGQLASLTSSIISDWADRILQENKSDPWIIEKGNKLNHDGSDPNYTMKEGILYYRNKFCLGPTSDLRKQVLDELHGTKGGGHSGYYRTLQRVRQKNFWYRMNKFVREFVAQCLVCQQVKILALKPMGLLQPLPIPIAIWEDLSMDFVTGLPVVLGHTVIIVVVDRLTKYCHLGSLPASYSAISVADYFIKQVIRLHGIPMTIVSDRDKIFLNKFWKEIFVRSGTTLKMTSAYHPDSDGQTEVVNKTIEQYLRATVHENQKN